MPRRTVNFATSVANFDPFLGLQNDIFCYKIPFVQLFELSPFGFRLARFGEVKFREKKSLHEISILMNLVRKSNTKIIGAPRDSRSTEVDKT